MPIKWSLISMPKVSQQTKAKPIKYANISHLHTIQYKYQFQQRSILQRLFAICTSIISIINGQYFNICIECINCTICGHIFLTFQFANSIYNLLLTFLLLQCVPSFVIHLNFAIFCVIFMYLFIYWGHAWTIAGV